MSPLAELFCSSCVLRSPNEEGGDPKESWSYSHVEGKRKAQALASYSKVPQSLVLRERATGWEGVRDLAWYQLASHQRVVMSLSFSICEVEEV